MKKDILKKSTTQIETYIDQSTGEVIESTAESNYYIANSDKEFFLMYSSMLSVLKGCKDPSINLFAGLIQRYGKGQEFVMSRELKDIIAAETKSSSRTFDRAFTYLQEEGLVVKVANRMYKINPKHVFQGSTSNRKEHLKAVLILDKEKRKY